MTKIRNLIINAIRESEPEINESDLVDLQKEFKNDLQECFDTSATVFKEIHTASQSHFLFGSGQKPERIVVIGDIHCDYESLRGVLYKIAISHYSYFELAHFIFLGDYIDRGALPFQTLRLLLKIKKILGNRCTLLRGNHDSFLYDEKRTEYYSSVNPAETIDLFNEYLQSEIISDFKAFFDRLPYFIIAHTKKFSYLIVHAGVPKDVFFESVKLNEISLIQLPIDCSKEEYVKQSNMLSSMLWGDPVDAPFKINSNSTRFEFGSEQFVKFMDAVKCDRMIRGHEPKRNGFESLYNDRLFTVFSSGGEGNEASFYSDQVSDPAFIIIDEEGDLHPESIFLYNINITGEIVGDDHFTEFNHLDDLYLPGHWKPYQFKINHNILSDQVRIDDSTSKPFLNKEFLLTVNLSTIPDLIIKKFFLAGSKLHKPNAGTETDITNKEDINTP